MALKGLSTTCLLLHGMKCSWPMKLLTEALLRPMPCRLYSGKLKVAVAGLTKENKSLVNCLQCMGVDIERARRRQPGVLKKMITHEQSVAQFLQSKGAAGETVASIISRYPRAITRTYEHLQKKWEIWKSILKTDSEIIRIVERSPESFFRSSNTTNLEENIKFLSSLGLTPSDLCRLLSRAPRTFSNRSELNRQMVELLQDVYFSLGGDRPEEFVKQVLSKNVFLLIRSTKRVKANIEFLQTGLGLKDKDLLALLQGHGADILDLSHEYIKRNFASAKQKLQSLGCTDSEVTSFFISYPPVLYLSPKNFIDKIDYLLRAKIDIKQVLEKPRVMDVSVATIISRVKELEKIDYSFQACGIGILDLSAKRFEAKLNKLTT
ncbi:transcription termination factor 1, mitochondrial [Rhinatrema bivittatum]|uniref:transcription termination factor 1, mitochondrial n=1 Tax=Rhinatrema bivittatum TaxID=194408 RepID=UPI00112EDA15|nr:transcription termination factor 1, mitochondrial [Rhinatrema bivittatum]XP_029444700.1 transcription termination factor 1, mitochondrial [Rhinatrema bivittatum]XP_029444702.1 transcription termination factor 1, mitochondrial [Rhinatrema bivittatum]